MLSEYCFILEGISQAKEKVTSICLEKDSRSSGTTRPYSEQGPAQQLTESNLLPQVEKALQSENNKDPLTLARYQTLSHQKLFEVSLRRKIMSLEIENQIRGMSGEDATPIFQREFDDFEQEVAKARTYVNGLYRTLAPSCPKKALAFLKDAHAILLATLSGFRSSDKPVKFCEDNVQECHDLLGRFYRPFLFP